jgi:hypothetical protein
MNQNIFVKQLTSQAWKEQFNVIGDMELVKSPKTGKAFFSYNTADGNQVLRASMRFLEEAYLDRAKKTGVMFGQTVEGNWIGFAKGDSSNVLLSGI